jgi:opacity protein-like surface antigen
MKSKKRIICLLIFTIIIFSLVTIAGPVAAEKSALSRGKAYMGIGYGYHDTDMKTDFTRRTNGVITEESSFKNNYNTRSGSLFMGYTLPWEQYYLSGQMGLNVFDTKFELTAGSSQFTNSLNHAFSMDLIPGFYFYKQLSVFAKLGIIYGDFDFIKSSPTSTTYDVSEYLLGGTLGVGLAYDITPRITIKLGYEQTWYEDIDINATQGTKSDKTIVGPEMETFFLILQYYF